MESPCISVTKYYRSVIRKIEEGNGRGALLFYDAKSKVYLRVKSLSGDLLSLSVDRSGFDTYDWLSRSRSLYFVLFSFFVLFRFSILAMGMARASRGYE